MPKGVYPRTELHREISRKASIGHIPWNKGYKYPEDKKPQPPHPSGQDHPMYGKKHTVETRNKISLSLIGKRTSKRLPRTQETKDKIRKSLRTGFIKNCECCNEEFYISHGDALLGGRYCSKKCQHQDYRGKKHANWKYGIAEQMPYKHYRNTAYIEWRKKVFERDNFTCQHCNTRGVFLHPHHIKSYTKFPEYRYDINNGLTLCVPCHKKIHSKREK